MGEAHMPAVDDLAHSLSELESVLVKTSDRERLFFEVAILNNPGLIEFASLYNDGIENTPGQNNSTTYETPEGMIFASAPKPADLHFEMMDAASISPSTPYTATVEEDKVYFFLYAADGVLGVGAAELRKSDEQTVTYRLTDDAIKRIPLAVVLKGLTASIDEIAALGESTGFQGDHQLSDNERALFKLRLEKTREHLQKHRQILVPEGPLKTY